MSHKGPEILQQMIQQKVDDSSRWFQDNGMVCSGDKTKLLVMETKEQRNMKLTSKENTLEINVLGLTVQNDLSLTVYQCNHSAHY
jgi:hypothetical protein